MVNVSLLRICRYLLNIRQCVLRKLFITLIIFKSNYLTQYFWLNVIEKSFYTTGKWAQKRLEDIEYLFRIYKTILRVLFENPQIVIKESKLFDNDVILLALTKRFDNGEKIVRVTIFIKHFFNSSFSWLVSVVDAEAYSNVQYFC
jgi:hypothetical protein